MLLAMVIYLLTAQTFGGKHYWNAYLLWKASDTMILPLHLNFLKPAMTLSFSGRSRSGTEFFFKSSTAQSPA